MAGPLDMHIPIPEFRRAESFVGKDEGFNLFATGSPPPLASPVVSSDLDFERGQSFEEKVSLLVGD